MPLTRSVGWFGERRLIDCSPCCVLACLFSSLGGRPARVSNPLIVMDEEIVDRVQVDRGRLEVLKVEVRPHVVKKLFAHVGW